MVQVAAEITKGIADGAPVSRAELVGGIGHGLILPPAGVRRCLDEVHGRLTAKLPHSLALPVVREDHASTIGGVLTRMRWHQTHTQLQMAY